MKTLADRIHLKIFNKIFRNGRRKSRLWDRYTTLLAKVKYRIAGRIICLFRNHGPIIRFPNHSYCERCLRVR